MKKEGTGRANPNRLEPKFAEVTKSGNSTRNESPSSQSVSTSASTSVSTSASTQSVSTSACVRRFQHIAPISDYHCISGSYGPPHLPSDLSLLSIDAADNPVVDEPVLAALGLAVPLGRRRRSHTAGAPVPLSVVRVGATRLVEAVAEPSCGNVQGQTKPR